MQVTLIPNDAKSSVIKKEEVYFAFQEGTIDKETLLKDLTKIDDAKKNKALHWLGKGIVLIVALIFPLLLISNTPD